MDLADPADVADELNWTGGYHELSVCLGPVDDVRLVAAVPAIWRAAGLEGPVPVLAELLATSRSLSVVEVPGLGRTCASLDLVREGWEPGPAGDPSAYGDDWLDLSLPLGALTRFEPRSWREPMEAWLVEVGRRVHADVGFAYALTGFEVSGTTLAEAQEGWVGVLRPAPDGSLEVRPVTRW